MLERIPFLEKIKNSFEINPIYAVLGPRQWGKTTLALDYAKLHTHGLGYHHFDLENPRHAVHLQRNPMLALESLDGLIGLDEIQRAPEIFSVLRYLVDHHKKRFLILGSASRDLLKQSSESLAGRISYLELTPFALGEVAEVDHSDLVMRKHWIQGGFPKAFFATTFGRAHSWLEEYIQSFLERDLSTLGISIKPIHMRQLWIWLAHYHGQFLNYSELDVHMGISHTTVRNYVEILSGTFMIRILRPFYANISKRQTKSPKVYIRDSGIAMRLLLIHNPQRIGFEFKYADSPQVTKSMRHALADLDLHTLFVISPKGAPFPLQEKIISCGFVEFMKSHFLNEIL